MTPKENLRIALDGGKPEYVPCFWTGGQILISTVIGNIPPMGMAEGYDWWGVHWTATEDSGGMFTPTVGKPRVLTDITKWREQVKFPDIESIDWEAAAARDTANVDPNKLTDFYGLGNGVFERIHFLMGFEEAMYAIAEEPEEVAALAGAIGDLYAEIARKVGRYYKPDYFTLLDDYTHKNGSFISPRTYDEIFAPAVRKIIDAVEESGMKFIQHCCGREEILLDSFHKNGIRRIEPCQPCNDVAAMKRRYPDMGFMGGLDLQGVVDIPGVTEEALRKEVRRCVAEYGPMESYAIWGCSVSMYSPMEYAPDRKMGILIDEAVRCSMERN